ncbi:hypothetical protein U1Q18_036575 [Sarracenia purpurea var. burkii]
MEWAPEADKNQIGPRSRNPDRDPSSNGDPKIEQKWPNVKMEICRRTTAKGDKRDGKGQQEAGRSRFIEEDEGSGTWSLQKVPRVGFTDAIVLLG